MKLSAYVWAWKGTVPVKKSLQLFRKFYPDGHFWINVDYDGDYERYHQFQSEFDNVTITRNDFQLGYCGDFGDVKTGRTHWPKESAFHWLDKLKIACETIDSEYMILLEEDDFILKPISILDTKFSMAIHPTAPSPVRHRPNPIPQQFKDYAVRMGGTGHSPGYAAGGGTIFNPKEFVTAWDKVRDQFYNDYDGLSRLNKIMGWEDFLFQFVMMMGGYEIIQNHKLCEHWEVPNFEGFEIITGLKDTEIIKNL